MAKLLALHKSRRFWFGISSAGAFAAVLLLYATAYASIYYSKKWTAYADGHRYNISGHEISIGDVANHAYDSQCQDPAKQWRNGTRITTFTPIYIQSSNGQWWGYTNFILNDVGDYQCKEPAYWVDVYQGRWDVNSPTCLCSGVYGFCYYSTQANSCTNATNFGVRYYDYTGP